MITKQVLLSDLKALGVKKGDLLNVKVSLKSIGKIEGGVVTLIDALLEAVGTEGTIFADAFVSSFSSYRVRLNPARYVTDSKTPSYAGVFVNAMINYPGSKRSPHPIHKFVAIGRNSEWVLEHNSQSSNYSVLFKLIEHGAKNLKIGSPEKVPGVGTTHCTIETLGWKELMRPLSVSYYNEKGQLKIYSHNWPTGCMKAFNKLVPLYEKELGWGTKGVVGNAFAMLTDMRLSYELELKVCQENPDFLRCDNPLCIRCRLGWKHSHDNFWVVLFDMVRRRNINGIWLCLCHKILYRYEPR